MKSFQNQNNIGVANKGVNLNTRIAPSPTGLFHIGTARTAYHNYLMAKASNSKFILRIDDTDVNRNKPEFIDVIISSMDWLNLDYDLLFKQSTRFDHYLEVANLLLNKNLASKIDGAIKLNYNLTLDSWNDLAAGKVKVSADDIKNINNLILIKSDQTPTYHFASVIDDIDYNIDLVLRGADHLANTIKQIAIHNALVSIDYTKKDLSTYCHVGLITLNGKKISKRNPESNLNFYKDNYKKDAFLNFILKLGWSHPDPIFDKTYPLVTKDIALSKILEGKFKFGNSLLDLNKLNWLNKKYT